MVDDHDPIASSSYPSTHLRYAIRSARPVVQALIARDRNAAEEAALRTCRDCDLLIRLIRDLVSVLRDPCNEQLDLSPLETIILTRRAEHVLALVEEQETDTRPPAQPDQPDAPAQAQQLHGRPITTGIQDSAPMISPLVAQNLTVASTGLRVRLMPVDDHDSSPTDKDQGHDRSEQAPSSPGSRPGERWGTCGTPLVEQTDLGTTRRARLPPRVRLAIWERASRICVLSEWCIDGVRERWIIEHIRALELGGADEPDNIGPAHAACAQAKRATTTSVPPKPNGRRSGILALSGPNAQCPAASEVVRRRRLTAASCRGNDPSSHSKSSLAANSTSATTILPVLERVRKKTMVQLKLGQNS
jgi:hypothetical protein